MAPGEHAAANAPANRNTLWLSIRLARENWLFEIAPGEERAILVGSLLRAHVRIDRHDIAPVHFHFERERGQIRICPAYGADVRVNGARIAGPYELEAHATIAFAGLELELYVCDVEPNVLEQLDLRNWTADELPDCGAVLSLPDGAEVTRSIARLSQGADAAAVETKAYTPLCDAHLRGEAVLTGKHATDTSVAEVTANADQAVRPSPIVSVGTATSDPVSRTTDLEATIPGVRASSPRRAVKETDSDIELAIEDFLSTAPTCSDPSNDITEPWDWPLTRVGIAARERPLAATLVAAFGAALLSLAMVATDALVNHEARGVSYPHQVVATTNLRAPAAELPPVGVSSAPASITPDGDIGVVPVVPHIAASGAPPTGARGARAVGARTLLHTSPKPSSREIEVRGLPRSRL